MSQLRIAELFTNFRTLGAHRGGTWTVGSGIETHSDHSLPIQQLSEQLPSGAQAALLNAHYQHADYKVTRLSQCTRTLYVQDVETGKHSELQLPLYKDWLKWLNSDPRVTKAQAALEEAEEKLLELKRDTDKETVNQANEALKQANEALKQAKEVLRIAKASGIDKLNTILVKGGKRNWFAWCLSPETFEEFRLEHGANHPEDLRKRIVLRTPPEDMYPAFKGGWVNMRWLKGSPHAGYSVVKRKRGDDPEFRTTFFATEPTVDGRYDSDKDSDPPQFLEKFNSLRTEIDQIIRTSGSPEIAAAQLENKSSHWEKQYRIRCMSGSSHAKFVPRVVLVIRSQPTLEQMRATLWHSGHLEMSLDEDPASLSTRRQTLIDDAERQVAGVEYDTVSSTIVVGDDVSRLLEETNKVLHTRLCNYLRYTCAEDAKNLPHPEDLEALYKEEYKTFRNGPHHKRGNVSDSCWRCTENGFGIFGAIFAYMHDLVNEVYPAENTTRDNMYIDTD